MDVLAELLPASYLVKLENTSKDSQHKNNPYQKYANPANEDVGQADESVKTKQASSNWGANDRRTGTDRRKQLAKRGRWLESRDRKDRRQQTEGLFVKI